MKYIYVLWLFFLNYVYPHRNEILYIIRNKKLDGKVTFSDIVDVIQLYKESGLIYSQEEETRETFTMGDIQELKENPSKNLVEIEQGSWECVMTSMARTITYNTKYIVDQKDIAEVRDRLKAKGKWGVGGGCTFKDCAEEYVSYMEETKRPVFFTTEFISGENYKEALKKGYMASIGGQITDKFISDFILDGIIDIDLYNFKEVKKYGHCFTSYGEERNEIDNYPKRFKEKNRRINHIDQETIFIQKGYFYPKGYLFFSQDQAKIDIPATKEKISQNSQYVKDLGIWDGLNPNEKASREEVAIMIGRAIKYLESKK